MELKSTHLGLQALGWGMLALVLLSAETLVATHLITAGDWHGIFGAELFFCGAIALAFILITLVIAIWPLVLIRRRRLLRRVASAPQLVPLASTQPDRQFPLREGERVVLARRPAGGNRVRKLGEAIRTVTVLLMVGTSGMGFVISVLPSLGNGSFNPLRDPFVFEASAPTALDLFSAVFPLLFVAFLAVLLPFVGATQRSHLSADDQGIALKVPLRRQRFVPWSDIRLFIRSDDNKSGTTAGIYTIWGHTHRLAFEIFGRDTAAPVSGSRTLNDTYEYEGGFDAYATNASRLLATIVARSYVPLQALPSSAFLLRRRRSLLGVLLDDAVTSPLAATAFQPSSEAIASGLRCSRGFRR